MRERPILFSGPMVRALLAGTKTQTRRAIRLTEQQQAWLRDPSLYLQTMYGTSPPPNPVKFGTPGLWRIVGPDYPDCEDDNVWCPYGAPGDRLWVRETARCVAQSEQPPLNRGRIDIDYKAGGGTSREYSLESPYHWFPSMDRNVDGTPRWQPAIHMPRWASRITLEITGVRVERLQAISEADAIAEGVEQVSTGQYRDYLNTDIPLFLDSPKASYASLWESINGAGSWDANPWVWVVSFSRVTA